MKSSASFGQCFVSVFGPVMEEMGYSRKLHIFHRLVNEKIVQRVSFKKYSGGSFTIQWANLPLIGEYEIDTFMDDWLLQNVVEKGETYSWPYTNDIDEYDVWEKYDYGTGEISVQIVQHYEKQMPICLEVCKKRLFPFLNSVYDYETYNNQMKWIYKRCTRPDADDSLAGYDIYQLSLYFGDYETAWKSMKKFLDTNLKGRSLTEIGPYWKELLESSIENYHKMREAAEKGDRETIVAYLKGNEEQSLQSYIKNYYGKRALEKYLNSN